MSESSAQSRPLIRMAIGPRFSEDRERFQEALRKIAQKDSVVRLKMGTLDGEAMISGMSELHLEGICDQISHEFKIKIDVGQPKVIYLETVRKHSEAEGKYIRQVGGALFCVAVSRTYSYSTVGSMLGRPRGIPLQRLLAHLLRAMPSWGLGSLSLAVQKVISQNES